MSWTFTFRFTSAVCCRSISMKKVEPRRVFFVISKDRGFDSLIVHIRSLGFDAHRVATIRAALSTAATSSPAPARPVVAKKTAAKKTPATRKQPAAKVAPKALPDVKAVGTKQATKPVDTPKQLVLTS